MKHISIILIGLILSFSLATFAKEIQPIKSAKAASSSSASKSTWGSNDHFVGLRLNALPLLLGAIDAELDFTLGDHLVIGPTLTYWNTTILDISMKITGFGVRGNFFFDKVYEDGWYLGAFAKSYSFDMSETLNSVKYTGEATTTIFGGGFGYLWVWDPFNMNLGLILAAASDAKLVLKDSLGNKDEVNVPSSGIGTGIEWTIGWTF